MLNVNSRPGEELPKSEKIRCDSRSCMCTWREPVHERRKARQAPTTTPACFLARAPNGSDVAWLRSLAWCRSSLSISGASAGTSKPDSFVVRSEQRRQNAITERCYSSCGHPTAQVRGPASPGVIPSPELTAAPAAVAIRGLRLPKSIAIACNTVCSMVQTSGLTFRLTWAGLHPLRFEPGHRAGAVRFVRDQGHPVRAAGPRSGAPNAGGMARGVSPEMRSHL